MVVVGTWVVMVGTGVLSKGDRLAVLLMASHLLLLPNPHCHNVEKWKKNMQTSFNIEAKTMILKLTNFGYIFWNAGKKKTTFGSGYAVH